MFLKRAILAGLPPLCVLAAIVAASQMPNAPQNEGADLGPLIDKMQGTFGQAEVTGSIGATGPLDPGSRDVDGTLSLKIPAIGQPKHRNKVARAAGTNQNTGYKPDITPPNFTNSAY